MFCYIDSSSYAAEQGYAVVRLTRNIDTRNAVMTSNVYRYTKFTRDSTAIRNELCGALSRPIQNFICGFTSQKWNATKETLEIKGQDLRSVFFSEGLSTAPF